jgi:hypothetical protein
VLPHAGDWRAVYRDAYAYNAPILARRADTHPGLELHEMNITRDDPALVTKADWPRGGTLPDTFSLVAIDAPELILSAVYRSGSSLIVRCYNITRQPVSGTVRFGPALAAAYRVTMAEVYQETLPLDDGHSVGVMLGGGEVYTLKVLLQEN